MESSSHVVNYMYNIRTFLEGGGNPNQCDRFQDTLLHISAKIQGSHEVVAKLIKAGAGVNMINFWGQTPLHIAVTQRNFSVVEALIDQGANVNIQDCHGNCVLHSAIKICASMDQDWNCVDPYCPHRLPDMQIIEKLLQQDSIDVNLRNLSGYTPLFLAVKDRNLDIVRALLEKSADVNIKNHLHETALHAALHYPSRSLYIADELLLNGASITCLDSKGRSPLDIVFQWVGGVKIKEFAQEFLKLVSFYPQNQELVRIAVRKNTRLSLLHNACVKEVDRMRQKIIGDESLYEIILYRMNNRTEAPLNIDIIKEIYDHSLQEGYFYYFPTILKCIVKYLLNLGTINISLRNEHKIMNKMT